MNEKILITYATRNGSTAGIAEAIGAAMVETGQQVDVLAMQHVRELSTYRAVVAGSAIQSGQWLPEAMQFMQTNRTELSRVPFAAFLACMTLAMKKGNYRDHVATWLDPVKMIVQPKSVGLFAGALDIGQIRSASDRFKFRLSVMLGVWAEGDHRDWNAIRAWSNQLPTIL